MMIKLLKTYSFILLLHSSFTFTSVTALRVDKANYNYQDPDNWAMDYPECGGQNQSPVALNIKEAKKGNYSSLLRLTGLDTIPDSATLAFDGRHVFLYFKWKDGENFTVMHGGPFGTNKYKLLMGIFSWSRDSDGGGHNTIDGKRSPLGLIFVFVNMKYSNIDEALVKPDGLAIIEKPIAEAAESGDEEINTALQQIIPSVSKLTEPDDQVEISPFLILNFVTPEEKKTGQFPALTYKGSMPVPPCYESATWVVSILPILATSEMIHSFNKLKLTANDRKNYRPVQPLNGRDVTFVVVT